MDNADFFLGIAQHALWVSALACGPILIPALVTGIVVGMFQAATSISEATLSFIPKVMVVGAVLVVFGGSILMLVVDFTREIFERIPDLLS
jgi:flagellar biosynthetic protein FliQ